MEASSASSATAAATTSFAMEARSDARCATTADGMVRVAGAIQFVVEGHANNTQMQLLLELLNIQPTQRATTASEAHHHQELEGEQVTGLALDLAHHDNA